MDIDRIRAETPGTRTVAHLLASGSALPPAPVTEAVIDHLRLEERIGGYEAQAARMPELNGIYDDVAALIGADTLPVRKPDPAPYHLSVREAGGLSDRSVLIGDTETDRLTAKAAGVPSVLVTFGPEGAGIARLSPEALLDRYADLPGLVEGLLPR